MENRKLLPVVGQNCAHVLSLDAIKAVMAAGKLKALDDMCFKEARVFKVYPGNDAAALYELTRSEKKKYASHFCNIGEPHVRDFGVLCALEDGDKLHGYIPYYSFADDLFGDEIMYAFFHKSIDAVVLLISKRGDVHAAANQVMHSMAEMTPFGKLCAWCGGRGGKLRKCPCKTVRYCGKECQHAHWGDHRCKCPYGDLKS
jgi:hypothetical protein